MHSIKYVKWACRISVLLVFTACLCQNECLAYAGGSVGIDFSDDYACVVSELNDSLSNITDAPEVSISMVENKVQGYSYQNNMSEFVGTDRIIDYAFDPMARGLEKMRKEQVKSRVKSIKDDYAMLEKGVYYTSLSANFTNIDATKLILEPIFEVNGLRTNNFDIELSYGQFVKDNLAFGFAVAYKFSDVRADVSSDILQLLINARRYETNNLSSGYRVGGYMRNYFPIEYTRRLYIVNEMQIMFSHTEGLQRNVFDEGVMLSKVRSRTFSGGLRMSLGIMYFLTHGLAIDFNISPVAAMYQYNSVLNNEKINGKFAGGGINTIIMPIDLKFGLSYYFGLDYDKRNKWLREVSDGPLNIYR